MLHKRPLIGLIASVIFLSVQGLADARPELVRIQPVVVRTHPATETPGSGNSYMGSRQPYIGTVKSLGGIFPQMLAMAYNPYTGGVFVSQSYNPAIISSVSRTGHAIQLALLKNAVYGLVYDRSTRLLYAAIGCAIVTISSTTGTVSPFVGGTCGTNDGTGPAAQFRGAAGMTLDVAGKVLYVSDLDRVRSATLAGVVKTVTAPGSIGPPQGYTSCYNRDPTGLYDGLAFDTDNGDVYVADTCNDVIKEIVPSTGAVMAIVGQCFPGQGYGCDDFYRDGQGTSALVSEPGYIAYNRHDHNLYVADTHNNQIRRISLSGGVTVTTLAGSGHPEYKDGVGASAGFYSPLGLVVAFDGSLLVADSGNQIIRTVVTQGPSPRPPPHGITLVDLPAVGEAPNALAAAADGSVWYSVQGANLLGRILPTGQITEFPLPSGVVPQKLAFDAAGDIWFINGPTVGKFTPSTGATTVYPIPSGNYAQDLTFGADGNIWYVTGDASSIGVVTPLGGIIEYASDLDHAVTAGFKADLWTLGSNRSQPGPGYLDQVSMHGNVLKRYSYANLVSGPIVRGPQQRIWFAQPYAIGEVFPHNVLLWQLPPGPTGPTTNGTWNPLGLVEGPDRALWFTANAPGYLCRMTDSGTFSAYEITAPRSAPIGIARAANGALWFSDPGAFKIGRWF
jgi:virginiamycin B lyase